MENPADSKNIGARRGFLVRMKLFGGGVFFGIARGIRIVVGVGETQVNEFDTMINARDEDVRRFKVEVHHLVGMETAHHIEQLEEQAVGVFPFGEEVGMMLGEITERLPIDIIHEDGIVGHGDIPHEVRMFEVITRLKLLPQGCDITRIRTQ